MKSILALVFALGTVLLLSACPATGVVCKSGTTPCGLGCVDVKSDTRNCGACGNACGNTQQCSSGECVCPSGTSPCDGSCVVLAADRKNCGSCGTSCTIEQVCEARTCQSTCAAGKKACDGACFDFQTSQTNCGACGVACLQGTTCRAAKCEFDAIAACYGSGHVIGFSSTGLGTLSDLGNSPAALAILNSTLLSLDGTDNKMYQGVTNRNAIQESRFSNAIGAAANQALVVGSNVYVVNAAAGTLQTFKRDADGGNVNQDAGVNAGERLSTVSEISFGMNSFPEGVAKLGNELFVPLYGGTGAENADAGQVVVRVSVNDTNAPVETARISLKELDLKPFDGGTTVARPFAITAHNGAIYVALNNLNPDSYEVEGPGLLAKINPADSGVSVIDLNGDSCANPVWLKSVGTSLVVSCAGKANFNSSFAVESLEKSGLVLLDSNDVIKSQWNSGCIDAGTRADGGAKCDWFFPGRFAVQNNRITLADQNAGRVVMLDVIDGGFVNVRGLQNAIDACPKDSNGIANVSDIVTP
jgi:hypothetical protein